jgi:hypothetical protein
MRKAKRKWIKKLLVGSSGVTLFEVMIALAFFAIIITPVMRSFITATKVNQTARETMIATDVANSLMEGISGKTYEEVVWALGEAATTGGFDPTDPTADKFSSINGDYYNQGHCATGCMKAGDYPDKWKGDYKIEGVTIPSNYAMTAESMTLDQLMARKAIFGLYMKTLTSTPVPGNTDTSDKMLWFGFSDERYADIPGATKKGVPVLTYMMYSRIQKDNMYFDAIITFIPRATTSNIDASLGVSSQEYFSYEVTVSVYRYDVNKTTGAWEGRFLSTYLFDGAPCAVLKGGIMNKAIQGE